MSQNATPPVYRRSSGHFIRHLVVIVVVLAVAIIGINVIHNSSTATPSVKLTAQTKWSATPRIVTGALSSVPSSVFNTIGVKSTKVLVTGLSSLGVKPPSTQKTSTKTLPEVLYVGADYCPFCAAERWPIVVALSRFGTFTNLGDTTSGAKDIFPNTQTLTFAKSKYKSKYITFASVEEFTNTPNKAGTGYKPLQKMTPSESKLFQRYDGTTGSIPFVLFGNRFFLSGASYSPSALAGLTRTQIAVHLGNSTLAVTQAIIASANYQVAAICSLTHQQPAKVCDAKGTKAADKKLGI